jgi:hypothetical protein
MTTYKEIKGTQIEVVSSDPSNPVEGQVWYNSTSNVLKGSVRTTAGAWATGGSLNTGRRAMGGAGTQTAALGIGGNSNPGSPPYDIKLAITEAYNGTSWTEVNDLNTARGYAARGSGGTQTSALYFGGKSSPGPSGDALTETWNGSNWTEVNDLNQDRYNLVGAGASNTSALAFTGTEPPFSAKTESWNGTNWTEVNDLNTARQQAAGFGIATSALATTGEDPSGRTSITELWNGTNWTEVNDTNAVRSGAGAAGATNTAGVIFGGFESSPVDSNVGKTESWNGTNWTEEADLSGPVYYQMQAGAGTASSAISFGGEGSSNQMRAGTEEWTGAGAPVTRTFTDS